MKPGKTIAAIAAAILACVPIAAQADIAQADIRTGAPVDGESAIGGSGALILLAVSVDALARAVTGR